MFSKKEEATPQVQPEFQVQNQTGTVQDLRIYRDSASDYIALRVSSKQKANSVSFHCPVRGFVDLPFVQIGDEISFAVEPMSNRNLRLVSFNINFEKR